MNNFQSLQGKTIVFIGGGNMARAIIMGLLSAKQRHHLDLTVGVSDHNDEKLADFAKLGVLTATPDTAHELIKMADVVVLAVKPQVIVEVAPSLAPYLGDKLVLSVLAGVSVAKLSGLLGTSNIVRTMPNLPASIGAGATGLFAGVSDDQKAIATAIMASSGITVWVQQEELLHAVTAVAGSAPAYFFYVMEHMVEQAVSMGLSADDAKLLASQSLIGAGLLAKEGDPATLRTQVTSKGGTTAQALAVLGETEVGKSFAKAMQACADRSRELGQ